MDKEVEISVLMSTYNESEIELKESIESIFNQSYKEFEFIIVVDNPKNDRLYEEIVKYSRIDNRIIVIRNSNNLGLAESLNEALKVAKGKYIARMDADDISLPNRFEIQRNYLDQNLDCDMVCGNFETINDVGEAVETKKRIPRSDDDLLNATKFIYLIAHPTVMMRRHRLLELGGYNNYITSQDYDLWLRMVGAHCKIHYIDSPLIKYRYRTNSIGGTKKIIQFLSGRYAKKLYRTNTVFNERDYRKYIDTKSQNPKCKKAIERFYNGLKYKRLHDLLYSIVISKECRHEFLDILIGRMYTRKEA